MLDYTRQRIREALQESRSAVLVTNGPAGVQAGQFPCEAVDLILYIFIPNTSDHLFNLEHFSDVIVLTPELEMKGEAKIFSPEALDVGLNLLKQPDADWYALVQVEPLRVQIRREGDWGSLETFDLSEKPRMISKD